MKITIITICFLSFVFSFSNSSFAGEAFPEGSLLNAAQEVESLQLEVGGRLALYESSRRELIEDRVDHIFSQAENAYHHQNDELAIRLYELFLETVQMSKKKDYLTAQKNLFFLFHRTGKAKEALSSFKKYLGGLTEEGSVFLTSISNMLRELLKRPRLYKKSRRSLQELLRSISPRLSNGQVYPKVYYYLIKLAQLLGLSDLSSQWMANLSNFARSNLDRSLATYLYAWQAERMKRPAIAIQLADDALDLLDSFEVKKGSSPPFPDLGLLKDQIHLLRGQIFSKEGKVGLGLEALGNISSDSSIFLKALIEKIFLFAGAGRWFDATQSLHLYLTKAEDKAHRARMARLLPFFELRARHFDKAKELVEKGTSALKSFRRELNKVSRSRSYEDLVRLLERYPDFFEPPKLQKELGLMYQEARPLQGKIRNLYNLRLETLASLAWAEPRTFRSKNRLQHIQFTSLASRLLFTLERLLQDQRVLYKEKLSKASQAKLERLLTAKRALRTQVSTYKRQQEPLHWRAEHGILEVQLKEVRGSLALADARLNALGFSVSDSISVERQRFLSSARGKTVEFMNEVEKIYEELYTESLIQQKTLLSRSSKKRLLSQRAILLLEELEVFKDFEGQISDFQDREIVEKTRFLQDSITGLLAQVYQALTRVEQEDQLFLEAHFQKSKNSLKEAQLFAKESEALSRGIADFSKYAVSLLTEHYAYETNRMLDRYYKWQADLEWLQFSVLEKRSVQVEKIFKEEEEMMRKSHVLQKNGMEGPWSEKVL